MILSFRSHFGSSRRYQALLYYFGFSSSLTLIAAPLTFMALAAQAAQRALEKLQRLQKSKTRADKLLNDYRYGRVIDVLSHDPAKLYQVEQ